MDSPNLLLNNEDILQINCPTDGRSYQGRSGKKWKSISFLSGYFEPKDFLFAWRQKIGEDAAQKITTEAAVNGSSIHAANEAYFSGTPTNLDSKQLAIFNQYLPFLRKVIEPLALEKAVLWENTINDISVGAGGTLDCAMKLRGSDFINELNQPLFEGDAYVLCDYKTKSKKPHPEHMLRYCLQLAAYTAALNKNTNCMFKINKAMILAATSKGFYPYYLSPMSINHYWLNFKQILLAYYSKTTFNWNQFSLDSNFYLPQLVKLID